ncbi:MAG: hypothetical protein HKO07_04965, partial [Pseudomonadales bacterium]|nr:hypothetical protein [Pseudomonadales bacterium]
NCHTPDSTTDSSSHARHDVGTIDSDSGQRRWSALTGFDTPAVLGAWSKPPFLHDGAAQSLQAAINAHTSLPALPAPEVDALAAFIQQAEAQDTADMGDLDADGIPDFQDPAPGNACAPSTFNANCAQDSDSDGTSDFEETESADSDGDGTPDYLESSVEDSDGDTFPDQQDPGNDNPCEPEVHFCSQNIPVMRWPHALLLGLALFAVTFANKRRLQVR